MFACWSWGGGSAAFFEVAVAVGVLVQLGWQKGLMCFKGVGNGVMWSWVRVASGPHRHAIPSLLPRLLLSPHLDPPDLFVVFGFLLSTLGEPSEGGVQYPTTSVW